MKTSSILIRITWGILVGLMMVLMFNYSKNILNAVGILNRGTVILVGIISYFTTYITRDLINRVL